MRGQELGLQCSRQESQNCLNYSAKGSDAIFCPPSTHTHKKERDGRMDEGREGRRKGGRERVTWATQFLHPEKFKLTNNDP